MATTWDPLKCSTTITLSNGNNTAIANTNHNAPNGVKTVHPITTKSYFETEMVSKSTEVYAAVGVGSLAWVPDTDYIGAGTNVNIGMLTTNGNANFNGSLLWSATGPAAGRRIATAVDPVARLYWARIETSAGVYGNWNASGTANPATGVGGNSFSTLTAPLFAACCCPGIVSTVADSWILHSAANDWTGTAPAGFGEINAPGTTYTQLITTTGASSVTVPTDWNSSNNFVGALASGGAGYRIATGALLSGGGAGGMYAQKNNVSLTPGASLPVQVAAAATGVTTATVVNGADSWAGNATQASAFVSAKAGPGGNTTTGGTAATTGGVGDVINNGGNGSNSVAATNGGGGGGAGGPNAAGNNANTNGSGGQGDGTSGGAGGAVSSVGTVGSAGTEFTDSFSGVVAGSGGGSGSSNAAFAGNGKAAGNYGAGGAGLFSSGTTSRAGGSSTKGFVVLQWTTPTGGGSVGTANGTSTATAVGASTAASSGTIAGTSTATAVGRSTAASSGTIAGTSTATAVSASTDAAVGTANGTSTATAMSATTAASSGTIAGTSTATAVGASTAASVGNAAGTSTATAVALIPGSVGTANGTSTATAVGKSTAASAGTITGTSTATAVGASTGASVGNAAGTSTATAVALVAGSAGTANGTSTATATGRSTAASVGNAAGTSTATAVAGNSGTAVQSLPVGQTANGTLLVEGSATQTLTVGQTASGGITDVFATAIQSIGLGQDTHAIIQDIPMAQYYPLPTDRVVSLPLGPGGSSVPGAISHYALVSSLANGVEALYNTNSATTNTSMTTAQSIGAGFVALKMTGALGAGGTLTTDTGPNIIAAMPNPNVGSSYQLRIINRSSGNFAWTLTANATGVTVNGTATIAQNTFRDFIMTITSTTAVVFQSVGVGTDS